MPLEAGVRLGPYQILAPIGAGGMGEVYRARDTKLDRDVAVKVLPPRLAESPLALARFEREAKAVAALSHPNILAIFDFGTEGGTAYAVMELLEGETLRDRMGRSEDRPLQELSAPISPRKAIDYAVQMARGLAAAHGKGIAHRDLKPGNVFVTTDGRVKILDFGLARQTLALPADATASPTFERHTEPGTVLGTVGYMSPEQVRGEGGDHRSDLFSFGCVLYELLAGRRAFQRGTSAETMTAILREEPPDLAVTTGGIGVSPGLARLVQHCLEKNPAERFQSASDIAFALEALAGVSTSAAHALPASPGQSRRWLAPAAALFAVVAAAAAFYAGRSTAVVDRHVSFTPLTYQPQTIFRALFAPDGKTIVFSAALKGTDVELFSASPEYPEARNLGLRNVQLLSVSSKNELAVLTKARFLSQRLFVGTLARMPLGGGAPREILESVREADWSPDGASLAIIREVNGRDRLEFPAGKVLYETGGYVSDVRVSPDGSRVAFFEHPVKYDDRGSVAVVDLAGKNTTLSDGYGDLEGLAWSRDGREVLFSDYKVYAAALAGGVRQVLESAGGLTLYDVSADGRWLASRDDHGYAMMVKPPGAREEVNLSWLDNSQPTKLSPDGRLLLFTEVSGAVGNNYAVCLRKTDGSPVVRLGEGYASDLSSDGKWAIGFVPGARDQLVIYPTGAGEARKLDAGPIERYRSARWFADGARLLICGSEAGRAERCYVQDVRGGPPRAITPDDTHGGFVSPDGSLVLVQRGADNVAELYPLSGGAPRSVPGLAKDDVVVKWNASGRSLVVSRGLLPARVDQLDVETGRRELLREIAPSNAVGALSLVRITIADDPNVYAYGVGQRLSRLFLVQGAR